MVVQCPTCQSKFRIADDKVTDRGVRVRCTSCKNVFQVKKAGAAGADPGPGTTIDLSALGASAVAKAGAGSRPTTDPLRKGAARPTTDPLRKAAARPTTDPLRNVAARPTTDPLRNVAARPPTDPLRNVAARPTTDPLRKAAARPTTDPLRKAAARPTTDPLRNAAGAATQRENGSGRKLDVDDLFGMAELTGEAPLSSGLDPALPAPAKPPPAPSPDFGDLDFELNEPPATNAARPPPPPAAAEAGVPSLDPLMPPPPPVENPAEPMALEDDPFGSTSPAASSAAELPVLDLTSGGSAEPRADAPAPRTPRPPTTGPVEPAPAPARALLSSALTGLLGAALALVVVIAAALSDETAAGWLGFGPAAQVIATGVVSGLYDTASGKPVFYVRGRVENRTSKVRGPVRVTAELVADGTSEAKAEAMAGAEPTPEDVWSVRSPADADRLSRTLQSARVARKLEPGASLPFFAVMAEPPADLLRHRLQIRVEAVDAWTPPAAKAARDK
ncbi:MAG TPA: zinc-ribbon domain-containing protein [Myxococcales bacterium]